MYTDSIIETGNEVVDEIGKWNISGNVIPANWYKWILRDCGKPNLLAITILSEIVFWYRPVEVRDEQTGYIKGFKKRFKGDILQKSYAQLSEQFGEGKATVKRAVDLLEKLGIVKRIFRDIKVDSTRTFNNIMFLTLDPEALYKITYTKNESPMQNKKETPSKDEMGLSSNLQGDCFQKENKTPTKYADTNTENTTKSTYKEHIYPITHIYANIKETEENERYADDIGIDEIKKRRLLVKKNIDYENMILTFTCSEDKKRFEELYELICDVVCMNDGYIRINGRNLPLEVVKERFLKLDSSHMESIMDSLDRTHSKVKNIRAYLLTTIYNAATSSTNELRQKINHGQYEYAVKIEKEEDSFDYSIYIDN